MSKGFVLRFIIYGIIVAYILVDLKVIKGPMYDWVLAQKGTDVTELKAKGVVATVYGQPIVKEQVTYRMEEYLYVRGRQLSAVSDTERESLYQHCLEELILEHLLRVKTHHNERKLPKVAPATLTAEVIQDRNQFTDEREFQDAIKRQGYAPSELALRAQAHLQQRQYLDRQIDTSVTERLTPDPVQLPTLRKIRHIFRSTVNAPSPEAIKQELQYSLGPIRTGWATFAEVSTWSNQDARAKNNEGNLGWVSPHRLPATLAETIFSLPIGEPTLVSSPLGWHYLEVLAEKPARTISGDLEAKRTTLENYKRSEGLTLYLRHLRYREDKNVKILE